MHEIATIISDILVEARPVLAVTYPGRIGFLTWTSEGDDGGEREISLLFFSSPKKCSNRRIGK